MKRTISFLLFFFLSFSLTSCENKEEYHTRTSFGMDTLIDYKISAPNAEKLTDEAEAITASLEDLLSATKEDSLVSGINRSESYTVSDDDDAFLSLLSVSLTLSEKTDGAFDPTVGKLVDLWQISHAGDDWRPPEKESVEKALQSVGYQTLTVRENTVTKENPDTAIDLGGIGKGYACGKICEFFSENAANGIVSFGGNVGIIGKKADGTVWRIAVKDPFHPETFSGTLSLPSGIVAVSGGYERFAEYDGMIYHHILDPKTGYPAESDLTSALVWVKEATAEGGALADGLSTALFVMGSERAIAFAETDTFDFDYLLVKNDGTILISERMRDLFAPSVSQK